MIHRTSATFFLTSVTGLLILSSGTPSDLPAQERLAVLDPVDAPVARAAELEARARAWTRNRPRWGRAADLYRRAAELRSESDPEGAESLHSSGRLYFYAGRLEESVRTLRSSGEAFLALGDVVSAAGAFLDAAWVAVRAGQGVEARALARRARLLASSPLLDAMDRSAILQRIEGDVGNPDGEAGPS